MYAEGENKISEEGREVSVTHKTEATKRDGPCKTFDEGVRW